LETNTSCDGGTLTWSSVLGHSLKKVDQEEKSSTAFHGTDVEAILALRRLVVLFTDSESESNMSDNDTEWDDEINL